MTGRVLTALMFVAALAVPALGQFHFGSVDVSAGYEGIFDPPGSLTPVSSATYTPNGMMAFLDNEASQNNRVCVSGYGCGGVNGHTISGPFASGQVFTCGSSTSGLNFRPCSVTKYYVRLLCPGFRTWSASASVSTRRGYRWGPPDSTTNAGRTSCYSLPPPPIDQCGEGSGDSEILILPLDGQVSSMKKLYRETGPLRKFETVADKSFFVNEYVVAERDRLTNRYVVVGSSNHAEVAEALENVETATPRRAFGPDRVLALKVARHRRAGHHPPRVQLDLSDGPSQLNVASRFDGPAIPADETWRFVVALDVRDSLNMAREAEVLWSERDVPVASLERLLDAVTVESNDQDEPGHRLIVYVVVAVTGTKMKIEQQTEVEPRCCCGEVLCP